MVVVNVDLYIYIFIKICPLSKDIVRVVLVVFVDVFFVYFVAVYMETH